MKELRDEGINLTPIARITTVTYQEGDLEYIVEDTEHGDAIIEWVKCKPWCGQTVFTFPDPRCEYNHALDGFEQPAPETNPETVEEPTEEATAEAVCALCESRVALTGCGCCPVPAELCGACCLLRHTERRYQLQRPLSLIHI